MVKDDDSDDGGSGNQHHVAEAKNNHAEGILDPEPLRKLFIGGLTYATTDAMLRQFYEQFGDLVDCIVMRDPATKRSRGFGFVSFATRAQVDAAMAARPHIIDGKAVDPKRAVPREQSSRGEANVSTKRLYVSGVREEHTEEMFNEHFQRYGNVEQVEIIQDKNTGKNRGFAFITFVDYDAVDKCVLEKSHMIDGKRCDVKKALSKDEMRKAQSDRERLDRGSRSRGEAFGRGPPGGGGGGWGGDPYGGGAWAAPPAAASGGGYGGGPWAAGGYGGGGAVGGYGGGGGAGGYGAPYAGAGGGWGGAAGGGGWGASAGAMGGRGTAWGGAQPQASPWAAGAAGQSSQPWKDPSGPVGGGYGGGGAGDYGSGGGGWGGQRGY